MESYYQNLRITAHKSSSFCSNYIALLIGFDNTLPLHNKILKWRTMKRYMCLLCGFIYDEEKGWPDDGIAPGTRWDQIAEDWVCPECGASKTDFTMVEI